MKTGSTIIPYLLIFLAISLILKFFGVINFDNSEILGYFLAFYGITLVYGGFTGKSKTSLFIGSVIFLSGLVISLIGNFSFIDASVLILPSALFIGGISLLMIFFLDRQNKIILSGAVFLIAFGIVITYMSGSLSLNSFITSFVNIFRKYWAALLIMVGILILVSREEKS